MRWCRKNTTQKLISSLFLFALVFQGVFALTESAIADSWGGTPEGRTPVSDTINTSATSSSGDGTAAAAGEGGGKLTCDFGELGCYMKQVFIWLLNMIYAFLSQYVASAAAGIFTWVVDPSNISGPTGILNLPAVYSLWKFIRDFFNLFFILILLFSAFATVFQVDSFNIRNIFKNVVLVALLINFSFPITRFLIDIANVPMYYFINDVLGNGTTSGGMAAMSALLGYSGITSTAFVTNQGDDITKVIMAVVFMFLFSISLLVLAVMMLVRLIALTLLLIFSPLGFASSLLPGGYGQKWWSKFWSYALFGPAAALMLVVAVRFLEAVYVGGSTFASINGVTTSMTVGTGSSSTITQVAFFTIPLILIWAAIGMANTFAIAGAATVTGLGYSLPRKFQDYTKQRVIGASKFAGRTAMKGAGAATRVVLPVDRVKGAYAGVKESFKDGGKVFGKELPTWATAAGRKEATDKRSATGKGFVQNGKEGVKSELKKLEDERVKKQVKENKEKGVTADKHLQTLNNNDASEFDKRVAALSLAQEGEIRTATQLAQSLEAVKGNADEFNQVLDKAKPEAIGSMNSTENARILALLNEQRPDGQAVYGTRQSDLRQSYNAKLKKENKIEYRIEADIAREINAGPTNDAQIRKIYASNLKMGAKDLSKQSGVIQSAKSGGTDPLARTYFEDLARNQKDYFEKILRSDDIKQEDMQVLVEIQNSVQNTQTTSQPQSPPRSQAWQNAQAAFNQPQNPGQNGSSQQNP